MNGTKNWFGIVVRDLMDKIVNVMRIEIKIVNTKLASQKEIMFVVNIYALQLVWIRILRANSEI